jgi:hypothetical protein
MAMTEDQYMNRRSWLIDTAETAKDKKNLKADLAKLDAEYKAKAKATPKAKAETKTPAKGSVAKTIDAKKFSPQLTPEDLAMKKLLEKKYGKIYG